MKDQIIEFQKARIEALEAELKRVKNTLNEISEVSTKKALDIKVMLSDPNFDKPIHNVNYEK